MLVDLARSSQLEGSLSHRAPPQGLREQIGDAIGRWWAPAVAAVSRMRSARMFHPEGWTFAARAVPLAPAGPLAELAERFDGSALVRCSAALWRGGREHLDVLGFALRVRRGADTTLDETPQRGDQDLLFATIRSPFTMVLAPLFTDATDFVTNRYWAVSPFAAVGSRYELRLSPCDPPPRGELPERRAARLIAAVSARRASWLLEARETWTLRWQPVARIELERQLLIDQAALHFDPFRAGLGVEPVGVVHAIRRAAYSASWAARPG